MVTVIFKNFKLKENICKCLESDICKNIIKFVKANRSCIRFAVFGIALISALTVSVSAVGITVGYNVSYKGEIVAIVQSSGILENAKSIAENNVDGKEAKKSIEYPMLSLTVTVEDKLDNAQRLADVIIENSENIVAGSSLIINGNSVALLESDALNTLLENRKNAFNIEGAQNEASFVDSVEVETGYYLKSKLMDLSEAESIVNNLPVKTVSTVVSDVTVPFTVKTVKTDSQSVGYSKVTTAGINGLSRKTEVVESISGQQISKTETALEVITKPTEQVVTVGTAAVKISPTEKAGVTSDGFIFPLANGQYTVSSYWGDGRGHKGIDLAAKSGVAIFAVAGGRVTYAGWHKDYGYNVTIDHGNGIETRYAHAKALCVSTGDTVSQGDMIATVGNTGYSTGNHLHFEVVLNGRRVNPAPYIGL